LLLQAGVKSIDCGFQAARKLNAYLKPKVISFMNRNSIKSLLAVAIGAACLGQDAASADEILIYKVGAARRWTENIVYFPESSSPVTRRSVAGTFRDTSYLLINRSSSEVVSVDYFRSVVDGARLAQYFISNESVKAWDGILPSATEHELQVIKAPGNGKFWQSLKKGFKSNPIDLIGGGLDLNGDGIDDTLDEGQVSFLSGAAGNRKLGAVTLPEVAAALRGMKREFANTEIGGSSTPYSFSHYEGFGPLTARLDARLSTQANALPAPANLTGVTSSDSTETLTLAGHGLVSGELIRFVSGVGFGDFVADTSYFVSVVDADQFRVSLTRGGSFLNILTDGTDGVFERTNTQGALKLVTDLLEKGGFDPGNPPAAN
jgi:hypothetical protein